MVYSLLLLHDNQKEYFIIKLGYNNRPGLCAFCSGSYTPDYF